MATQDHTTSRRSVLAGLAALPAAAAAPALAAGPGPDPDAELVRLGKEWHATFSRSEKASDEDFEDVSEARFAIEDAILATPAAGLVGLGVKAGMAKRIGLGHAPYIDENITQDLLRITGHVTA